MMGKTEVKRESGFFENFSDATWRVKNMAIKFGGFTDFDDFLDKVNNYENEHSYWKIQFKDVEKSMAEFIVAELIKIGFLVKIKGGGVEISPNYTTLNMKWSLDSNFNFWWKQAGKEKIDIRNKLENWSQRKEQVFKSELRKKWGVLCK